VQNVKARDFSPCEPFIIQGRPSIDETGYFELTEPPGFAGILANHKSSDRKVGRPPATGEDRARHMKAEGTSYREIAGTLGVSVGTIANWLKTDVR